METNSGVAVGSNEEMQQEALLEQDDSSLTQEEMVLRVISAMVNSEIEGALSIMQELKHPQVVPKESNE